MSPKPRQTNDKEWSYVADETDHDVDDSDLEWINAKRVRRNREKTDSHSAVRRVVAWLKNTLR